MCQHAMIERRIAPMKILETVRQITTKTQTVLLAQRGQNITQILGTTRELIDNDRKVAHPVIDFPHVLDNSLRPIRIACQSGLLEIDIALE